LLAARAAARRCGSQIALEPAGFDAVRIGWAPQRALARRSGRALRALGANRNA